VFQVCVLAADLTTAAAQSGGSGPAVSSNNGTLAASRSDERAATPRILGPTWEYLIVGMSDRDRKILWGRSGNRCAICKISLAAERTFRDRESVVGDEAHIAADSPLGPRYNECDPAKVDAYDNRILLCKVHHKLVDDQLQDYTSERLLRIKAEHEAWVENRLTEKIDPEPIQIIADPSSEPPQLNLLHTGGDVWSIVEGVQAYVFGDFDEDCIDQEVGEIVAVFLQNAKDWAEISGDVKDRGMVAIRDAKRSLGAGLTALRDRGLLVFGGRERHIVRGGVLPPGY